MFLGESSGKLVLTNAVSRAVGWAEYVMFETSAKVRISGRLLRRRPIHVCEPCFVAIASGDAQDISTMSDFGALKSMSQSERRFVLVGGEMRLGVDISN